MFEDGVAEALAKESLVSDEDIGRAHFASLQVANEALGLGKGTHSLYWVAD